jgi:beta-RFAP synthase
VGLLIDAPGLALTAERSGEWNADGPLAPRVLQVAERLAAALEGAGTPLVPARIRIERAPEEHIGLGVGTQLSLAVGRVLLALSGIPEPPIRDLAALCGRGLRSGIGLHGFAAGGLVVDGGRRTSESVPPLLARYAFPPEWSVLVILPGRMRGLHGSDEVRAFAELPPVSDVVTDRLCRLLLLGLLPALVERDLVGFGAALTEVQDHVGRCFAPAQGGTFARPELASIVAYLRDLGLHGVGQSSWGPALYAFSDEAPERRTAIVRRICDRFGLGPHCVFWTRASERGAVMSHSDVGDEITS